MLADVRGIIAEQLGTDLEKVRAARRCRPSAAAASVNPGCLAAG